MVPTSCTIVNGKVNLTPGIAWGEVAQQDATMVAPLTCQLSRGGPLSGTMTLVATFLKLGFTGGQTSGSGSINWNNGQSTQATSRIEVIPAGDNTSYDVVLSMTFGSGFGAPGYGNTSKLNVVGLFDPVTSRVIQITGMNGTFSWKKQ